MHISGWAHMLRALTVDDVGDADDNEHLTVRTANLKHHAPPARWPPVGGGEAPPPLPSDVQDKLLLASYRGCSTELFLQACESARVTELPKSQVQPLRTFLIIF